MLLEYEWGNPAAAAAAMLLFGEDASSVSANHHNMCEERQMYDHLGYGAQADLFTQPAAAPAPVLTAAGLFPIASSASSSASCHQRYGLGLPPAPTRIGLNLGVRTYFSSTSPEEGIAVGRVSRRRTRTARCQAEGCGADLTHAKHYHRRHKVCEFHSKASIVIAAGLSQRFCQQCSRFHVLSEFDQGKRSCRKRLADHNRRRRKSQDLTTTTTTIIPTSTKTGNENNNATEALPISEKLLFTPSNSSTSNPQATCPSAFMECKCNPESASSATGASSPPAPPPLQPMAPQMALGLGGYSHDDGVLVVQASAGLSGSSSTSTSPQNPPFLSVLGDFRGHDHHRFPSWDDGEDGSTMRGLFQTK